MAAWSCLLKLPTNRSRRFWLCSCDRASGEGVGACGNVGSRVFYTGDGTACGWRCQSRECATSGPLCCFPPRLYRVQGAREGFDTRAGVSGRIPGPGWFALGVCMWRRGIIGCGAPPGKRRGPRLELRRDLASKFLTRFTHHLYCTPSLQPDPAVLAP